ncbi:nuclear transport factor 2 family protein [Draconibacterium sp. IB214405]|uniref:nuclear transport factor 2 family protein n=1 Tax=Draconibacterium sp. IB214405 TaxID=3097352 RepID=UPI002A0EF058|nr:nuclear transport factor 2 family protein [Draconibacterium sp. IB214405]MDX8340433.1 nuclear transport factor 2 family protein [Draconibacterium sp. IB214405]
MKARSQIISLVGILLLLIACNHQTNNTEVDSGAIVEQVKSQVEAFYTADTAMNAQGVIDLLWPEYTMLTDGNYSTYDDIKAGTEPFMESLEAFHTKWTELKIIPLGNQHAISSFIFTDSIVAKDGTITQSTGPNTFVWEERDGQWKLIYGDADHYTVK